MIDHRTHQLLSTGVSFSFEPNLGGWRLHCAANEGYRDLARRTVTPEQMTAIAKAIDTALLGESDWRTPISNVVEDAHEAARKKLAYDIKALDSAVERRERMFEAQAAFEAVTTVTVEPDNNPGKVNP